MDAHEMSHFSKCHIDVKTTSDMKKVTLYTIVNLHGDKLGRQVILYMLDSYM